MGAALTVGQNWKFGAAALLALAALAGCDQRNSYVPPPPPKVTVAQPVKGSVTLYLQATGNAAAVNTGNLVARVPGFVEKINYKDGDLVKKGTVLFTIEPESYDLKFKQSQAMEDAARSTVKQTEADFQRQENLVKSNAVSQSAYDAARANRDTARGNLTQNEINTKLAAINH